MSSKISACVKLLWSPTKQLANRLKARKDEEGRAEVIMRLNWVYFTLSLVSVAGLFSADKIWALAPGQTLKFFWIWFLLSRCNEVFWAFLIDAREHFDGAGQKSNLSYGDRLALSLRSYVELMINFGIIYLFAPKTYWKDSHAFSSIIDSVYFSGATITTTGYGDITPCNPLMQILSIYEVFSGVILLVVCFTIYASKGMALAATKKVEESDAESKP